jgi:hypothetical protein
MMQHQKGSTSGTILVILLVIVVGYVVWHVTTKKNAETNEPAVQLNLGSTEGSDQY